MTTIVSLSKARQRREQLASRPLYNASPFMSPVPQLIGLLEPILESVRESNQGGGETTRADLVEYLDLLDLARREIDLLEDMAHFLQELCD